ncbi:MAG: hypothetical protein R3B99_24275 [Polyangiales bacterium]
MVLVGIRVNMFNLLVVPVGFGIAIDGAIYVAWHLREGGSAARNTFRAVLFSTLTTLTRSARSSRTTPGFRASVGSRSRDEHRDGINPVWLPALMTVLGGNAAGRSQARRSEAAKAEHSVPRRAVAAVARSHGGHAGRRPELGALGR